MGTWTIRGERKDSVCIIEFWVKGYKDGYHLFSVKFENEDEAASFAEECVFCREVDFCVLYAVGCVDDERRRVFFLGRYE